MPVAMNKRILVFLAVLSFTVLALGQQSARTRRGGVVTTGGSAPWGLSDDERITRRQNDAAPQQVHAAAGNSPASSETINGREHPELFLSYELFDNLIYGLRSNQALSANAHKLYDLRIRNYFGYDALRFWDTLRQAAGRYSESLDLAAGHPGRTDFITSSGKKLWVPVSPELCVARMASLQKARELFGADSFDRFLYIVVAPEIRYSSGGTVTSAERAEQLRYMLRGCK